jgi:tetratricopeptide (TPR) repeat protein
MRACWLLPWILLLIVPSRAAGQQMPGPPDLPPAYRGGAIDVALTAHDWAQAEHLLVQVIEAAPDSAALLQVLGSVFLIERKPLNAAIAIKKAEALGPIDDRARFTLVLAYVSIGHGDWARPELERLAASRPGDPTYQYWLGRLDYDAGLYASAVKRFEQAIASDPTFVRAYDNLGLSYEALNQPDQALPAYRKAVELNRDASVKSPWPAINMGILLRNRGDLTGAEALLRAAVAQGGKLAQAHYQLGVLLEQEERLDEALRELVRAAECDPSYAEPHYALARIYRRQGHADQAVQALATFERLHDAKRETTPR